eukprot:1855743-Pleurochrysis_carterae.AAC.3
MGYPIHVAERACEGGSREKLISHAELWRRRCHCWSWACGPSIHGLAAVRACVHWCVAGSIESWRSRLPIYPPLFELEPQREQLSVACIH